MSKKVLILRFSEDITQAGIIDIQCHAIHYGMTADEFNIKTERDLDRALKNGNKYDYLYIAGHGNDSCIGDERGIIPR